jgi:hypothetical protein
LKPKSCFRVNHRAKKVSAYAWNFLEGAGNVLGPSGIFLERTGMKNSMFPDRGQDPTIHGLVLMGFSSRRNSPFWREKKGGWKGGGAPHAGSTNSAMGLGGPPLGLPSTIWWKRSSPPYVAWWKDPSPFWSFHPMTSTPCSPYK